jgi:hypothetical protein
MALLPVISIASLKKGSNIICTIVAFIASSAGLLPVNAEDREICWRHLSTLPSGMIAVSARKPWPNGCGERPTVEIPYPYSLKVKVRFPASDEETICEILPVPQGYMVKSRAPKDQCGGYPAAVIQKISRMDKHAATDVCWRHLSTLPSGMIAVSARKPWPDGCGERPTVEIPYPYSLKVKVRFPAGDEETICEILPIPQGYIIKSRAPNDQCGGYPASIIEKIR